MGDGVNETSSPEYASYFRHREEVKRVLNRTGAAADELFFQINQMIMEYAWMAANDRYWWWWPGHSPTNEFRSKERSSILRHEALQSITCAHSRILLDLL